MPAKRFSISLTAILAVFALTLFATRASAASQETVLYSFAKNSFPFANLIADAAGNLYGTSAGGGLVCNQGYPCGIAFELERGGNGKWTEKVLHTFGKGKDGRDPYTGLVFHAGNLYGVTAYGGNAPCRDVNDIGCGVVFELSPKTGGGWTEKVLYNFGKRNDGTQPYGDLIFDAAGNLYGTTSVGGTRHMGTVFELTPKAGGGWAEKVLYSFGSNPNNTPDGSNPEAALVLDGSGNLYGTTMMGGAGNCNQGCGTVFELSPKLGGGWREKVLHRFDTGNDGGYPIARLIFDTAGNLYSTTIGGGAYGGGTVFELTPKTGGGWKETVLHNFANKGKGGNGAAAPLIFDAAGNLYSTTVQGGAVRSFNGTVFELTPNGSGGWTEIVLYAFRGGNDGSEPYAGLVRDRSGNLYGTTVYGGANDGGTLFEVTP
jgi:uncharacterized repeat protein (TIGR03803 family)